jgi:hypothetical protein
MVHCFDEDGELCANVVKTNFDRWMTDGSYLVPIESSGKEEIRHARIFQELDETKLFRCNR